MMVSTFAEDGADEVLKCEGGLEISIFYRPYLFEFLEDMKSRFELIIYSSLNRQALVPIIQKLEEHKKFFQYVFDETFCIFANISYGVKCVDFLLSNRRVEDIILVDTSAKSLPLSQDNFVPVPRYDGNKEETELIRLATVLGALEKENDIREAIKKLRKNVF